MDATDQRVSFEISELPLGYREQGVVKAYGFDRKETSYDPPERRIFDGYVGGMKGKGEPFLSLLTENPTTLAQEAALYNAYLLHRLGMIELDLDQKTLLGHKFDTPYQGNILGTLVDFGDRGYATRQGGYRGVTLINQPDAVEIKHNRLVARGGERIPAKWPKRGFVGLTCDGAYDPNGVPFETWEDFDAAKKTWEDAGADLVSLNGVASHVDSARQGSGMYLLTTLNTQSLDGCFPLKFLDLTSPSVSSPLIGVRSVSYE